MLFYEDPRVEHLLTKIKMYLQWTFLKNYLMLWSALWTAFGNVLSCNMQQEDWPTTTKVQYVQIPMIAEHRWYLIEPQSPDWRFMYLNIAFLAKGKNYPSDLM